MPIILEFTFVDLTSEVVRIPAEIWNRLPSDLQPGRASCEHQAPVSDRGETRTQAESLRYIHCIPLRRLTRIRTSVHGAITGNRP